MKHGTTSHITQTRKNLALVFITTSNHIQKLKRVPVSIGIRGNHTSKPCKYTTKIIKSWHVFPCPGDSRHARERPRAAPGRRSTRSRARPGPAPTAPGREARRPYGGACQARPLRAAFLGCWRRHCPTCPYPLPAVTPTCSSEDAYFTPSPLSWDQTWVPAPSFASQNGATCCARPLKARYPLCGVFPSRRAR